MQDKHTTKGDERLTGADAVVCTVSQVDSDGVASADVRRGNSSDHGRLWLLPNGRCVCYTHAGATLRALIDADPEAMSHDHDGTQPYAVGITLEESAVLAAMLLVPKVAAEWGVPVGYAVECEDCFPHRYKVVPA